MSQKMKNLREVTSKVIEQMFFMNEETVPDTYDAKYKYCAYIDHAELKINLCCGNDLTKILTENFLGTEDFDENDMKDVLKEILNMIAGNYVGEYLREFPDSIPVPKIISFSKMQNQIICPVKHYFMKACLSVYRLRIDYEQNKSISSR